MLKFKDSTGKYHKKGYYYLYFHIGDKFISDNWVEIFLDGDEIVIKNSTSEMLDFIGSTIGGRPRYYLLPDFNSDRLSIVEL